MLDEIHKDSYRHVNDASIYTLGRIGEHNVVVACLPYGQMGTSSASAVATRMMFTFPSIEFGLMVGVGGGVPSQNFDIRLGDVVVSRPTLSHGGVVQYDFGKTTESGFLRTGCLNAPPTLLLNAIAKLEADRGQAEARFMKCFSKLNAWQEFSQEGVGPDVLFEPSYNHIDGETCTNCDQKRVIKRKPRGRNFMVHYGTIASGNQVMRDATERDKVSSELGGVLCFEMEAAGLMNTFPCLVIRGICDYADSHKNKRWQTYAGGAAAVYAKQVLSVIPSADVSRLELVIIILQEKMAQEFPAVQSSFMERASIETRSSGKNNPEKPKKLSF
jgi:nucleoside phosphorylase